MTIGLLAFHALASILMYMSALYNGDNRSGYSAALQAYLNRIQIRMCHCRNCLHLLVKTVVLVYMSALYNGQTISQAFHALQASRIKEFFIVGAAYILLVKTIDVVHLLNCCNATFYQRVR